jgi:hypothetical protein
MCETPLSLLLNTHMYMQSINYGTVKLRKINISNKNKKIENRKRVFTHFTHSVAKNQYRSILHIQITLKQIRKIIRNISIYFPDRKAGTYLFTPTSGNRSPINISQQVPPQYSFDVHRFLKNQEAKTKIKSQELDYRIRSAYQTCKYSASYYIYNAVFL